MDPLASPVLKLNRAHEHCTAFNQKLTDFQKEHPYTTYFEKDPYSSHQIHKVRVVGRPRPDPQWGTIVGDFVSNLRAALDHLVWAMAVNPKEPHSVEFPIDKTPLDLTAFNSEHRRRIGEIPGEAKEIIHGLQPDKCWGVIAEDPLWRIKRLANADKHRTVTVIGSAFQLLGSGNAALGYGPLLVPFPESAEIDPVIPLGSNPTGWAYGSTNFDARLTFAVVTTDGFQVPVDHLLGLHDFVRDKVFPLFPERFFPK